MSSLSNKKRKGGYSGSSLGGGVTHSSSSPLVAGIGTFAGWIIGYGVIGFLVLFMLARTGWPSLFDGLQPQILILPIYFWGVYRPQFFPVWLTVVLGLMMDLILADPLGMTPLVALMVQWLVANQARMLRELPAIGVMAMAAIPITLAELLRWLLTSILQFDLYPVFPSLWAALIGFALYVPLSLVFHKVHRLLSHS